MLLYILLYYLCFQFFFNEVNGEGKIDALIDFLKINRGSFHINALFCPKTKSRMRNYSKISFENGVKFRTSQNEITFLDHPLDAGIQLNILDMECESTQIVLEKASISGLLKKPFKWCVFGSISEIENFNIYPAVDSQFWVFEKSGTAYKVVSMHKINQNSTQFLKETIGFWNSESQFRNYSHPNVYITRRNLNRTNFPLSLWASNQITFQYFEEYRYIHFDASIRFTYKITKLLTSMLNANRTLIIYKKAYGEAIEDIKTGRVIMGAIPIFFVGNRLEWLDYVAPNTPSYLYFIFRAPALSYVTNIFTRPFQRNVWYSLFILSAITFGVMYLIARWERSEKSFEILIDSIEPSADDVAIFEMGVLSQQGSDKELKSVSGRIAFIFALISFMFFYTAYSGMIVALLQSTSNMITTPEDLLSSGIELGVDNLPYALQYIKTVSEPIKKEIYTKKLASKGNKYIMSLSDGVEKMRNEFFAFHTEQTSAYKVIGDTFQESEKCKLQEIVFLNLVEPWIVATKNHTYKELIKISLFRLKEVGFYSAERRRIFYEKPKCTGKISSFVSAGIIDTYAAFLFFGVGLMIAIGVFLIELTTTAFFAKKMKNKMMRLYYTRRMY